MVLTHVVSVPKTPPNAPRFRSSPFDDPVTAPM